MNQIHLLARAIIIDQGHILLVHNPLKPQKGFYYLPGGHIELGEGAEFALKRELMEEMGIQVTIQRFLGCFEHEFSKNLLPHGNICHTHEYNLLFAVDSPMLSFKNTITPQEEKVAFQWIPLDQLDEVMFLPQALQPHLASWYEEEHASAFKSSVPSSAR
jgi:8-oxo-dGTP diphosphatase